MTEIHHFLRLLYMKLGSQYCPHCDIPVEPQRADQIVANIMQRYAGRHIGVLAPLVKARKGYYTDLAKWAGARGHSHLRVDGEFVAVRPWPRLDRYKEHTIELPIADFIVDVRNERELRDAVAQALEHGQGTLSILLDLTAANGSLDERRANGIS